MAGKLSSKYVGLLLTAMAAIVWKLFERWEFFLIVFPITVSVQKNECVGLQSSLKWNSYTLKLTERMDRLPRANLISDHPLLGWCKKDPSGQAPVIAQGWNPWLRTFTSRAGNGRTHSHAENRHRKLALCQNLREKMYG